MIQLDMASLPVGALFYPCCNHDILTPVVAFADWITDFWFADVGFHRQDHWRRHHDNGRRFNTVFSLKPKLREYLHKTGEWIWHPAPTPYNPAMARRRWTEPVCLSESFERRSDGKPLTIHLRRGDAVKCLQKNEFNTISVFFYRGDSQGEGGSGLYWLGEKLFSQVWSKMPEGAALATDGSNCRGPKLRTLRQFHHGNPEPPPPRFKYRDGWEFELHGNLEDHDIPEPRHTKIWRKRARGGTL